jgi:uncharacterized protein YggE
MKARLFGTLVLGVIIIFAVCAWTSESSSSGEPGVITVTGDADVRVVPDEVVLTLGIETWDKDLAVARRQNDEIVVRVLGLVSEYGVEPQHAQTDYVSIEPRYRFGTYDEEDFIGYFVQKTIVVTLRDLSKFEGLLVEALDLGVNHVLGIQFRTTELRKHRDEARGLAIRAAREKAVAMAGELGQKVGSPKTIYEQQGGWRSWYNAWWGSRYGGGMAQNVIQEIGTGGMSAESSLAPGQITVNAKVTVTFDLAD